MVLASVRAAASNTSPAGRSDPSDCFSVYTSVPVPPVADGNVTVVFTWSAVHAKSAWAPKDWPPTNTATLKNCESLAPLASVTR